jgi:hypothetical protein
VLSTIAIILFDCLHHPFVFVVALMPIVNAPDAAIPMVLDSVHRIAAEA